MKALKIIGRIALAFLGVMIFNYLLWEAVSYE